MADGMDSDTSIGFRRRMTEFQETLSQCSASPSPSPSPSPITAEDKQSSEIVSTPKQDQEDSPSFISESSPNSKKALCSPLEQPSGTNIEEKQELIGSVNENYPSCGSVPFSSGSEGIDVATAGNGEVSFVSDVFVKDVTGNILNDEKESLFLDFIDKDVKDNGKYEVGVSSILESEKFCEVVGGYIGMKVGSSVIQSETELENKKKQLLEELETMLVPEDKCRDEKVYGFESSSRIVELNGKISDCQEEQRLIRENVENVDPLKGIDGYVGCPLGIKVMDETALIEQVTFPKIVGNSSGKNVGFVVPAIRTKKNGKLNVKENDENKGKRSRRRSKGWKKTLHFDGKPKNVAETTEGNSLCLTNREMNELAYSRHALMALRFVNIMEQGKKWKDIYVGLGPVVGKEYDDLATSHYQKSSHLHFDPRQRIGKREESPAIFGETCSGNLDTELGNMVENPSLLDVTCSHRTGDEDDYEDVEGEHNEDDDSEDDYASIQRPAFLVEGEPNFDSGPPEDGFEYLRRVRWEASKISKVRVAKFDRSKITKDQSVYMPQIPEIAKCPEHLMPSKKWEDAFLVEFSELRMALSCLDDSTTNDSGYLQLETIFGVKSNYNQLRNCIILESPEKVQIKEAQSNQLDGYSILEHSSDPLRLASPEENSVSSQPNNSVPKSSKNGNSSDSPLLSVIFGMSSVARASTLRKRINSLEDASTFSRNDCLWLFALCAAIDTPVDADTSASFRSLLRKCASLRAAKWKLDGEVVMLNILTTISGRYFGQSES